MAKLHCTLVDSITPAAPTKRRPASYFPNDAEQIFESRGRSTAARRRALEAKKTVRTEGAAIDFDRLIQKHAGDGDYNADKYASDHMQEWVEKQAEDLGIRSTDYQGNNVAIQNQKALNPLKEAYKLAMIKEDRASGLNDKGQGIIDEAIRQRYSEALGKGGSEEKRAVKRLEQYRGGDDTMGVGDRQGLFNPDMGENPIVKENIQTPANKQLVALDLQINEHDDKLDELQMSFIEDPGNTFKETTLQAKVGNFGSRKDPVVGMGGEVGAMEAAFMKEKRRDFAGYARVQVERAYDQAIEDLQRNASGDNPSLSQRNRIIGRFAQSVSQMTGGAMSQQKVRSDVIDDTIGSQKAADFFNITYTDELSTALEENANLQTMMRGAKTSGRSMEEVLKKGATMYQRAQRQEPVKGEPVSRRQAEKKMAGLMSTQLENEIKNVEEITSNETIDSYFDGDRQKVEEKKSEYQRSIRKLKEQKAELDKLYRGEITDISDSNLSEKGSLFDFFVDAESGDATTSFMALPTSHNVDSPPTGGSTTGEDFEARSGRATARKRSSLLSSALVGHSASHTMGALGRKEKMAAETFQGWLASKSGAAAFSDKKFQREVYNALKRAGVDAKKHFDPDKIRETADGPMYRTSGGEVPLEQYVENRFDWDTDSGQLIFKDEYGNEKPLQVDAYTTLRDTRRKQAGVLGMITGELNTGSVSGKEVGGAAWHLCGPSGSIGGLPRSRRARGGDRVGSTRPACPH